MWDVVPVDSATFTPSADASVDESRPTTNLGTLSPIEVDGGSTSIEGNLRFEPTGISGPVSEARLRVWVTNGTN
jgi:hypothetical protein